MKIYNFYKKFIQLPGLKTGRLLLFLSLINFSCESWEKEFLSETPLDFYAPENSFVTYDDFIAAIFNLYFRFRNDFWDDSTSGGFPYAGFQGTDLVHGTSRAGLIAWAGNIQPTSASVYNYFWKPAYRIIYDANAIIERADAPSSKLNEQQNMLIKAEAMFFRGFMYKMLANMYGGVPITLKETSEPKRDYVRATREETYLQALSDLKFAAENLPDIDQVDDSRVSNLAAHHLLSEVYISLEQWTNAINAATLVITYPGMALMTERFGTQVDPAGNRYPAPFNDTVYGGDVFWDLFRPGNQNRSAGNTEAIWVTQYAIDVPGGADGGFALERQVCPRTYRASVRNNNGTNQLIAPDANTYLSGRGIGGLRPTNYFLWELWKKSGYNQDMRNSKYNMIRDIPVMNPASDHFGKWVYRDKLPLKYSAESDSTRDWYPYAAKATTVGRHPQYLYSPDQTVPGTLNSSARLTYRDNYIIRLAETYLLRAEAHLGNSDPVKAAADINVVRQRSQAPDVLPTEVDIDYILDERMRELCWEEFRILTLRRLGLLVARTKKYNPLITYEEYHNLYPIPYSEIEKNTGAVLEQNPGY